LSFSTTGDAGGRGGRELSGEAADAGVASAMPSTAPALSKPSPASETRFVSGFSMNDLQVDEPKNR
jgi:hypothetical protein